MNDEEVSEYLELIEKLQKEKKGNPNDLENYKQILIEDRKLHESNLKYLKFLDGQEKSMQYKIKKNQRKQDGLLITTTPNIEGSKIVEYFGIVSGQAIMGGNVFRDMIASVSDAIGGRSGLYESKFTEAEEMAFFDMEEQAIEDGANAIVGVKIDHEMVRNDMMSVSVHGTAVKAVKEKKEIKSSKKN